MITIEEAVKNFKELIEGSIIEGGNEAKTAMIRSSRPILHIHEAVKTQLIENGVNRKLIYPPLGQRTPEIKLAGSLKQKNQDICVSPNDIKATIKILEVGLLEGIEDAYGDDFTKKTLAINNTSDSF
jgi:hypothetical protein